MFRLLLSGLFIAFPCFAANHPLLLRVPSADGRHELLLPNYLNLEPADLLAEEQSVEKLVDATIEALKKVTTPTTENYLVPLDEAQTRIDSLQEIYEIYGMMNLGRPGVEEMNEKMEPLLVSLKMKLLSQDFVVAPLKLVMDQSDDVQVRTAADSFLKKMRMMGIGLSADKKAEVASLASRMSDLRNEFTGNTEKSVKAKPLHIEDEALLDGVDDTFKKAWAAAAQKANKPGFLIQLRDLPVLRTITEANNEEFRKRVYMEHAQLLNEGPHSNVAVVEQLARLRSQAAQVIDGEKNFAELRSEEKWLGSLQAIQEFVDDLASKYAPLEKEELDLLQRIFGPEAAKAWNREYYKRLVQEHALGISAKDLRKYFPLDVVSRLVVKTVGDVFDIEVIERHDLPLPSADWTAFEFRTRAGEPLGLFVQDLFGREGKANGAWNSQLLPSYGRNGHRSPAVLITQMSILKPSGGSPLLSLNEVRTLFHEMGHAAHVLLSRAEFGSISGTKVPHDAVEIPSKTFEYFGRTRAFFEQLRHVETGQPLSPDVISRLEGYANLFAGMTEMSLVRRIRIDLGWHTGQFLSQPGSIAEREIAAIYGSDDSSPSPYFAASPSTYHIFGQGTDHYAGGLYSYLVADAGSAQAASLLIKDGEVDRAAAQSYLDNVLAPGSAINWEGFTGSRKVDPSFKLRQDRERATSKVDCNGLLRGPLE